MKEDVYYVYAYLDPREKYDSDLNYRPFYIGKGKNNRKNDHINEPCGKNYLKYKYLSSMKKDNILPIIVLIKENMNENDAFILEKHLIKQYGRIDNDSGILCNLTDGGEGTSGRKCTDTTRSKISEANKNKVAWNKNKSHKEDKRIYHGKSYIRTEETLKKISISQKICKSTKEHKEKFVEIMTSDEVIEKRRKKIIENGSLRGENNPIYGTKRSNETVAKIKNTLIKYKYTIIKDGKILQTDVIFIKDWAKDNGFSFSTIEKSAKMNHTITSGKLQGYLFMREKRDE